MMNSTRRLAITASIVIAAFGLWAIFNFANHYGKAKLIINVLPADSLLSIDGKIAKPGRVYLPPGNHTLSAERTGFSKVTKKLELKTSDSQQVTLTPTPSTAQATQYLLQHPEIQKQLQAFGDSEANQISQSLLNRWPIVSKLPHTDPEGAYVLGYGLTNENNDFYLVIDNSSPDGRAGALQWIKQQGYDPTNFLIKYKDFANPFISGEFGVSQ